MVQVVYSLSTALVLLPLFVSNLVYAQTSETGEKEFSQEIVVTAQKREQSLQDVPLTVNAFTADRIEDARITEVEDISLLTPGLEFGAGAGRQIGFYSIRGINSGTLGTSGVVTYVDGFTLGNNFTVPNVRLFDLERIEVLKGPQATLYGRNALGGVISYISKKPSSEFEGKFEGSIGNYNAVSVSGVIGGPLVEDVLKAQVGIAFRDRDGYFDNSATGKANFNSERDIDYRATLDYTPLESDFSATLTVNHNVTRDDAGASAYSPRDFSVLSVADVGNGLIDLEAYDRELEYNNPGFLDRDITTVVLNMDYSFGDLVINSITGYGHISIDNEIDVDRGLDRSPFVDPLFASERERRDVYSQELRLTSNSQGRFQWLIGGYAFFETFDRVATLNGGPLDASINDVTNLAAFANVSYEVVDGLTIGAGLRYDYTEIENRDDIFAISRELNEDELLPKFFISYEPSRELTFFASASKGFKSGGFNPIGSGDSVFLPEFVWHYEAGLKGRLNFGGIRYSVSYYHIDWSDQQLTQFDIITGFFTNAGESSIRGVEAEIFAEPIDGLELFSGVSWIDGKFNRFELNPTNGLLGFGISADLSGNKIPYTPKISLSGSAQYTMAVTDDFEAKLRADARFTGKRELHFTGVLSQPAYALVNLYAGLENENYQIGFFADNVFDEKFHSLGELVPSIGPILGTGDPLTYGVRASARF